MALRAGLFLMPFGFLNEHHEPTNFYGVQRNFVETLIIPSTWREGGLGLHGDTAFGLALGRGIDHGLRPVQVGLRPRGSALPTALDLGNSDAPPLQATHQELALANAQHLSQYVALSYYGIPGLSLGAAISTGDAVKVPAPPNAPLPGNQRVTLWEGHARWTPGKLDLSAHLRARHDQQSRGHQRLQPGLAQPDPVRVLRLLSAGRLHVMGAWRLPARAVRALGVLQHGLAL